MSPRTINQNAIDEFLNESVFTGTFRNKIGGWSSPADNLELEVFIVTGRENRPDSPLYDKTAPISGSFYEVVFNGKRYERTFSHEVHELVRALLERHAGLSEPA